MFQRLGLIFVLLAVLIGSAFAAPTSTQAPNKVLLKLKSGDIIRVVVIGFPEYSMDYPVLTDGNVSGVGFGLIKVADRTIPAVQKEITAKLTRFVKNPKVAVILTLESQQSIFIVSLNANFSNANSASGPTTSGAFPYNPKSDLRSTISLVGAPFPVEEYSVSIYRNGKEFKSVELSDLISGTGKDWEGKVWNGPMAPNDVVTIIPKPRIKVWVLGLVKKPGEYSVRTDETLEKLLANAGGVDLTNAEYNDLTVFIRRGPEMIERPLRTDSKSDLTNLQPGDTIIVQPPATIRVTISGYVNEPGIFTVRANSNLQSIIGSASKGLQLTASLRNVIVVRGEDVFVVDATVSKGNSKMFKVKDGDSIFVQEIQNAFYVIGEVKTAARYLMDDEKREYRLSDALAIAGGTTDSGTLRRITVITVVDGKYVEKQYNLDEFLKDGKIESNPVIKPGDVIFFGKPKGFNAGSLLQVLPSLLVLQNLVRK